MNILDLCDDILLMIEDEVKYNIQEKENKKKYREVIKDVNVLGGIYYWRHYDELATDNSSFSDYIRYLMDIDDIIDYRRHLSSSLTLPH